MTVTTLGIPSPVAAILRHPATWFLARLALVGAYLLVGVVKASDWHSAVAEQAHFGMHPPALWAGTTILVELMGSLLILSGRFVWFGAGMLGVFTFFAALTANPFWTLPSGQERFMATNAFFEHLGLIGGFVLAAVAAQAIDRRKDRQSA